MLCWRLIDILVKLHISRLTHMGYSSAEPLVRCTRSLHKQHVELKHSNFPAGPLSDACRVRFGAPSSTSQGTQDGAAAPGHAQSSGGADLQELQRALRDPLDELFPEDGFDDSDEDPELNMELEDFARRLNIPDWQVAHAPARMPSPQSLCGRFCGHPRGFMST